MKTWSKAGIARLDQIPLHRVQREVLKDMLEDLRQVCSRIAELEKRLFEYTTALHGSRQTCLKSVPGVGPLPASSFLAELFRPEGFKRGEEVAAYLELAPIVRHIGKKSPAGRLHPTGHNRLRALLVEDAWIWQSRAKGIYDYYTRVLSHSGLPQKAITAVARKLALVLWRLACEVRLYRSA